MKAFQNDKHPVFFRYIHFNIIASVGFELIILGSTSRSHVPEYIALWGSGKV